MNFWKEVTAYKHEADAAVAGPASGAGAASVALLKSARALTDKFIRSSAAAQVNLLSSVQSAIVKTVDANSGSGGSSTSPPPSLAALRDLFNTAHHDIFVLMERDTMPRFRASPLFV